jgi:hypothetical protein
VQEFIEIGRRKPINRLKRAYRRALGFSVSNRQPCLLDVSRPKRSRRRSRRQSRGGASIRLKNSFSYSRTAAV